MDVPDVMNVLNETDVMNVLDVMNVMNEFHARGWVSFWFSFSLSFPSMKRRYLYS